MTETPQAGPTLEQEIEAREFHLDMAEGLVVARSEERLKPFWQMLREMRRRFVLACSRKPKDMYELGYHHGGVKVLQIVLDTVEMSSENVALLRKELEEKGREKKRRDDQDLAFGADRDLVRAFEKANHEEDAEKWG